MSSFIWILIFAGVMYWMHGSGGGCCGGHNHGNSGRYESGGNHEDSSSTSLFNSQFQVINGQTLYKDPVCGSNVAKDVAIKKNINGIDYYFCSQECLNKFIKNIKKS
ncbi:MAG: YHS domain-containing protein [Firmicutes bacterium]|nr:YHS domain-containing protein [Bacillota bacterium]